MAPRPVIIPLPVANTGYVNKIISLNGTWKTTTAPATNYWKGTTGLSLWKETNVPGRGFGGGGGGDAKKAFKKQVLIPAEFTGKRVLIRFDGVSGGTKLWVNGTYIREHWGGFYPWRADITQLVTPGKEAWVTDRFPLVQEMILREVDRCNILNKVNL